MSDEYIIYDVDDCLSCCFLEEASAIGGKSVYWCKLALSKAADYSGDLVGTYPEWCPLKKNDVVVRQTNDKA